MVIRQGIFLFATAISYLNAKINFTTGVQETVHSEEFIFNMV